MKENVRELGTILVTLKNLRMLAMMACGLVHKAALTGVWIVVKKILAAF